MGRRRYAAAHGAPTLRPLLILLNAGLGALALAYALLVARCSADTTREVEELRAKDSAALAEEREVARREALVASEQNRVKARLDVAPPKTLAEVESAVGAKACFCGPEPGRPGRHTIWRMRVDTAVTGPSVYACDLGDRPIAIDLLAGGCRPEDRPFSITFPPYVEPGKEP